MTKQNINTSIVAMALTAYGDEFGVDKVYNMLIPVFGNGLSRTAVECACFAAKNGYKDIDSTVTMLSLCAGASKAEGNITAENGAVIVNGVNSGSISVNVTLGSDKNTTETSAVTKSAGEKKVDKGRSMTPEESDKIFDSGEYDHTFFVAVNRKQGAKGLAYELDGEIHTVPYTKEFATNKGLSGYLLNILKDVEGSILTSHLDLAVSDPERFIYACGKTGTKVYKKWSALLDMAKTISSSADKDNGGEERKRSARGSRKRGSEKPEEVATEAVSESQETTEEAEQ